MIEPDTDSEVSSEDENEYENMGNEYENVSLHGQPIGARKAGMCQVTDSPLDPDRQSISSRRSAASPIPGLARRSSSQRSLPSFKDKEERVSEADEETEDNERKERLQIYVFISRCIAYPFNAKQPTDIPRRQSKVTKNNLISIKDRFSAFLSGKTSIIADEAFRNAIQSYFDSFLCCDRVAKMVSSGGYSSNDFREVFKSNIEKRVRSLPEIEGLSKETVLSSWMVKFDAIYRGDEDQKRTPARLAATAASELILSKEQLYEMFQTILGVKKYEHQILFNTCQLDNADEQAACIRRELQSRRKALEVMTQEAMSRKQKMPKFVHKDMEDIFIEEQKSMVNQLMANLESFPVAKTGSEGKVGLYKMKKAQSNAITMMDVQDETDAPKLNSMEFTLQITVMEATGLNSLPPDRIVFVVMELEGDEKLQTDQAEASKPVWESQGEWTINQPLPVVRLRLMAEDNSLFALDHKELAKCTLSISCGMSDSHEWYSMMPHKNWTGDKIKLKVSAKMEKPQNVKKCGYLYAQGKTKWRKWKKRFFMLIQVSQYNFNLCSYQSKKPHPTDRMAMQGYTVDFSEPIIDEKHQGGRFFFKAVKEGDQVIFASEEDMDRQTWVYKLYNATGQSFKPSAPKLVMPATASTNSLARAKGDTDRARKHGLDDVIAADPVVYEHASLFEKLQQLTLLHRLNDSYTCLGWFSPGQVFVLDEYCARYGVRGCHRHLCYLSDLLERAENGIMIDPTLLHYSYAFCASHVLGNRPDGVNTVTIDEKAQFEEIKERLRDFLANQITHFRYCFPFGRPEGALKSTLTLYERVLTKDAITPAEPEDVRPAVRACLRKAALVNYTRLSAYAKIEEISGPEVSPSEKLEKVMQLAELCMELIQQNEEHHAEALAWYAELMVEHTEIFWSLYSVDMDAALSSQPPDTWDSFALFQMLNNYLRMEPSLSGGKFHQYLRDKFAPLAIRYVDLMESSIARSLDKGFSKEMWTPVGTGVASSEEIFWKLQSIQAFIRDLHWPDDDFSEHIVMRMKLMASDMTESIVKRVVEALTRIMRDVSVDYDFIVPREVCVMLNVLCQCNEQAGILCASENVILDEYRYHSNAIDVINEAQRDCIDLIVTKGHLNVPIVQQPCNRLRMSAIMERLLKKLSRYDHGKLTAAIFNLVKVNREETIEKFLDFIVGNIRQFDAQLNRQLGDEFFLQLMQGLWEKLCKLWCDWLVERQEVALHPNQFTLLSEIIESCSQIFKDEGLQERILENDNFKAAYSKLQIEKALLNLNEPSVLSDRNMEFESYKRQTVDSDYDD